jgi:hypothetical protein
MSTIDPQQTSRLTAIWQASALGATPIFAPQYRVN